MILFCLLHLKTKAQLYVELSKLVVCIPFSQINGLVLVENQIIGALFNYVFYNNRSQTVLFFCSLKIVHKFMNTCIKIAMEDFN